MILLDTCVYLYAVFDPTRLSARARRVLTARENTLLWSPVSTWEVITKAALGRFDYPDNALNNLERGLRELGTLELPFEQKHAIAGRALPNLHRDPFDRMLISQALSEGIPVITSDAQWAAYGVAVVW